jgi:heterotetrameric sarcosine oxidase gamma subunit
VLESRAFNLPGNAFIALVAPRQIYSLAVFRDRLPDLQSALGLTLPTTPRRIESAGTIILWSGPGSWLLLGAHLPDAVQNFAAVTDQTDGRAIFQITGPPARKILAKLIPIDLHESAFPPDATALTLAGHINVQIWRDGDAFQIACFRSFAESLFHDLLTASREFEDSF